jgi:hypothetical protein
MFRTKGLQQNSTRRLSSASASGNLMKELERSFSGSKIPTSKPKISINNAHQGQIREMPPFRDDLRADD